MSSSHYVWRWGRTANSDYTIGSSNAPSRSQSASRRDERSINEKALAHAVSATPRLIDNVSSSTSFRHVTAAATYVTALSSAGALYVWGDGPATNPAYPVSTTPTTPASVYSSPPTPTRSQSQVNFHRSAAAISPADATNFARATGVESIKLVSTGHRRSIIYAITADSDVYEWNWSEQPTAFATSTDDDAADTEGAAAKRSDHMSSVFTFPLRQSPQYQSRLPRLLPSLHSLQCIAVACGNSHTLFLTSEGTMYAVGIGSHGRLGLGHMNDVKEPTMIPTPHTVTRISVGHSHNACISSDGVLLTWGCGLNGRLGSGRSLCEDEAIPMTVTCDLDAAIVDVVCGYHHTVALRRHWSRLVFRWK